MKFDFRSDDGEPLAKCDTAGDFLKAHISGHATKTGAYVSDHEDSRPDAKDKKPGKGGDGVPATVANVTHALGGSGWDHKDGKSVCQQSLKWNGSGHIDTAEALHEHGFRGSYSDNEREEYTHPDGHVATIERGKGEEGGKGATLTIKH